MVAYGGGKLNMNMYKTTLLKDFFLNKTCTLDEVNAVVLDIGTTTTRAGYAGEDTPRVIFPTTFGYIDENENAQQADGDTVMTDGNETNSATKKRHYFIGDNKLHKFRSHMEIKNPLKDGLGKRNAKEWGGCILTYIEYS